ncbi:MAG: LysR family transcriptional regulator [Myxococcota bacterium]
MFAFMQRRTSSQLTSFPWDDVQLFLVLYRSRTMGEAAKTLRVNISTVSRRLTALEDALDTALFERGRDGLSPTKAAEELLVAAEQTEAAVASFANAVDGLERDVSGTVRIACPPDMADVVLLPVLRKLLAVHPRLRVVLSPGEATVDLVRREADLAVRTVRPTRGDLVARRVFTISWVPAASPATAERLGVVEDLGSVPWIGWGPRFARAPASQWLARFSLEPVLETDSIRTQIAAAQAGLGVALVPHPNVEHYGLVRVTLGGLEPQERLPQNEIFMVTHRTLRSVPRIRVVWEALLTDLEQRFG